LLNMETINDHVKAAKVAIDAWLYPGGTVKLALHHLDKAKESTDARAAQKHINIAKNLLNQEGGVCDEVAVILGCLEAALYGGEPLDHQGKFARRTPWA